MIFSLKLPTLSICSALLLVGCGGEGSDNSRPPATPPPVSSNPPTASLSSSFYADSGTSTSVSVDATDDRGITRYIWEQTFGQPVTLTNSDNRELTIALPESETAYEIGVKVTVFDAQNQTAEATSVLRANPIVASSQVVNVNISGSSGLEISDDNPALFVSGRLATPVTDDSTIPARIDSDNTSFAAVTNDIGTPLLITYKPVSNGLLELSIDTSAVSYVVRSPRFYGTRITDYDGLARQIEQHSAYSSLVETIGERIQNSPCPMQPSCNRLGARYAERIAQDISITDFVEVVQ